MEEPLATARLKEDKVEIVARAIAIHGGYDPDKERGGAFQWQAFSPMARAAIAAIAAMHEPTEAMIGMLTEALRARAADADSGGAYNTLLMLRAAEEIERLEAECFKLAAGVCEHRSGNDHGNPLCLKTKELI